MGGARWQAARIELPETRLVKHNPNRQGKLESQHRRRAEHTTGTAYRSQVRYVDGKFNDGGMFHRTVTPLNRPENKVKIEVIQAAINPNKAKDEFPPIKLGRTRDTNLTHKDDLDRPRRAGHGNVGLLPVHRRPAGGGLRRWS